jgi:AraC-like DNA-binding protein
MTNDSYGSSSSNNGTPPELVNALRDLSKKSTGSTNHKTSPNNTTSSDPRHEGRPTHEDRSRWARERVREESCVFIGPSNVGKTCTLVALNSACYAESGESDCILAIINDPETNKEEHLAQHATNWIGFDQPPPATEQRQNYKVEISTHIPGRLFQPAQLIVTSLYVTDGPGGSLFPSRADSQGIAIEHKLVEQAAKATTLVLVIDSTAPAIELVERHLARRFDQISQSSPSEDLPQSDVVNFLDRLGLRRSRDVCRRTRLKASRFLLLLTKIDVLALTMSQQLQMEGVEISPLQVAKAIDPVGLAIELLGSRTLRRIRRAITVGASFAVGLSSTTGFHRESGESFLEWCKGRPAADRFKAWTPYGIREALIYITTGHLGGSIQRIDSEAQLSDRAISLASFPFGGICDGKQTSEF